MKRTAFGLLTCLAISGWTTVAAAQEEPAPAQGEDQEKPAAGGESLETQEAKPEKVESEEAGPQRVQGPLSWQDIVVVPRKAFLKTGRTELMPFTGVSINDNLIRHFAFGADFNYFLTDVLWVGLQGEYFLKELTQRETSIGLQYNRITNLNRYLFGAALNFGYVPIYGKFSIFNRQIIHWETFASAGIGFVRSEIIPKNPADLPFTNDAISPNFAIGSRFFLNDWLTINFNIRDYVIPDKFEPIDRDNFPNGSDPSVAKQRAVSQIVNNMMLYVGCGIFLPTKFSYQTAR